MELNPLRRVFKAKAEAFFGLAMLVAVVMLVIASFDSVGQAMDNLAAKEGYRSHRILEFARMEE
jgi:hypothetical protein